MQCDEVYARDEESGGEGANRDCCEDAGMKIEQTQAMGGTRSAC